MGAHLRFFKNYYRYGGCSLTLFFCQLLWLGFGFWIWVRINIKVIAWVTVKYVMFRVGARARIAILYSRAGANKLSLFQMMGFYGLLA